MEMFGEGKEKVICNFQRQEWLTKTSWTYLTQPEDSYPLHLKKQAQVQSSWKEGVVHWGPLWLEENDIFWP